MMLKNLKEFLRHSAVYSISNAAVKASGVILLPLYTKYMTTSEYGVYAILEATLLIIVEILNLGLHQALVMMNNSPEFSKKKKSIFFSIFAVTLVISVIFIFIGEFSTPYISKIFEEPEVFYSYLRIAVYIIALRLIYNLFLNKLRADDQSGMFTLLNIIKLLIMLTLVIYFVAFAGYKVMGIMYSYLITEILTFLFVSPLMFKRMSLVFEKKIVSVAFKFGVPLIFGSVAMMLLNLSDRYIIKYLTDYSSVGIYNLGYSFAGILNMFLITPFGLALMPIAYKMFGKEGDTKYYSKILTYLTYILVWAGLGLSIFSMEIIKTFTLNSSYWPAYKIAPVIIFSYIFFGMRFMSSLGMFLTRNTKHIAYSTIIASVLNIVLNFIFIPVFGVIAAAYTTLISFILLYFVTLHFSNKFYVIQFEHTKLFKVIILGVMFYSLASVTFDMNIYLRFPIKLFLVILFPYILYLIKFYDPVELDRIFGILNKWKNPSKWKSNIKSELTNTLKD